jgi:hypothetical protein
MSSTAKHTTGVDDELEQGDAKRLCSKFVVDADSQSDKKLAADATTTMLTETLTGIKSSVQMMLDTLATAKAPPPPPPLTPAKRALLVTIAVDEADDCHTVLIEEDADFFPESFDAVWGKATEVESRDKDANSCHMALLMHWPQQKHPGKWPIDRSERRDALQAKLKKGKVLRIPYFSSNEYDNSALYNNGTPYLVWHVSLGCI